jgi:hypothetical protein
VFPSWLETQDKWMVKRSPKVALSALVTMRPAFKRPSLPKSYVSDNLRAERPKRKHQNHCLYGGVLAAGEARRSKRPKFKQLRRPDVLIFSRESFQFARVAAKDTDVESSLLTSCVRPHRTRQLNRPLRSIAVDYVGHCVSVQGVQ